MPRPILLVVKGADRLLSLVVVGASGVAAAAIFIMAVLMAANVISRQVFDRPFLTQFCWVSSP
jgi:TRAP-type C4-dicarboxylate transport system permease small subunit